MISQLYEFDIPQISDALDMLGHDGGLPGILPVVRSDKMIGRAYTVAFRPSAAGEAAPAADYIDEIPAGSIVVIDNQGRTDCTVWGGILSQVAQRRSLAGTVIHGACRDIGDAEGLPYPLFASGIYMKSGKNRVIMSAQNEPICIDQTVVRPGDVIAGDANGVLCIPYEAISEVVRLAREIKQMESRILASTSDGTSLKDARQLHRYSDFAFRGRFE